MTESQTSTSHHRPAAPLVAPSPHGSRTESPPAWRRLGEILVERNAIGTRDLERALAAQQEMGGRIGDVLVRLGLVSERDIAAALVEQQGFDWVESGAWPDAPLDVEGLAPEFLRAHGALPWKIEDGRLHAIVADPGDAFVGKALKLATGLPVTLHLGLETELRDAVETLYSAPAATEENAESDWGDAPADDEFVEHLKDLASEAPVIRLVNEIIAEAIESGASDIHLEPGADALEVRYRVDGVLAHAQTIEARLAPAALSRVKLMARLNIAERRLPQDGRIMTRLKGRELDLRVSSLPTVHGESIVMRVLDRESMRFELSDMGFDAAILDIYRKLLARPHGIVLLTGPTGSGKTTTLYASLARMDSATRKILTVEDPVEYQLAGINQIHVHAEIGLTFARALRAILRQDPDIIMIGEMRDSETAQIAVQAALTGHLVLSTLHTNTAVGAVARLQDMNVERYLLSSTLNGVLAQRLVRRLCPACRQPEPISAERARALGLGNEAMTIWQPRGCPECRDTGYRGRIGIHELLVLDDEMRDAIVAGEDSPRLAAIARKAGMRSLFEDGLSKVRAGVTSYEEVLRVAQDQAND